MLLEKVTFGSYESTISYASDNGFISSYSFLGNFQQLMEFVDVK